MRWKIVKKVELTENEGNDRKKTSQFSVFREAIPKCKVK
jgi:hypothetical protein